MFYTNLNSNPATCLCVISRVRVEAASRKFRVEQEIEAVIQYDTF